MLYRRRLPHVRVVERPVFLTWRLHGSLPAGRWFPGGEMSSGQAFAALDRLLDEGSSGPLYLKEPEIAGMVVEALWYNARVLRHYELHTFAVMPNHVHLLVTPLAPLPKLTKSIKGITGKRGNALLGLTGRPFWQEESYDRTVRNEIEFERIRGYIEQNPVKAGLVREAREYRWCSAWGDQGVARGSGDPPPKHGDQGEGEVG